MLAKSTLGTTLPVVRPDSFSHHALIVDDLACRRGERLIFEGIAFRLQSGQALALTGRNGAGKSSLLALICGRLRPAAGSIRLEGAGETPLPELIHLVGHRDGLKLALTARENLGFAQAVLGEAALSPDDALDAVGLRHVAELPAGYLSAGQRRRVALARLLVARRPFWLLDEPMAALDAGSQAMLTGLVRGHLGEGGAVLAATHGPLGLDGVGELRLGP